jgi:hypothetical protein
MDNSNPHSTAKRQAIQFSSSNPPETKRFETKIWPLFVSGSSGVDSVLQEGNNRRHPFMTKNNHNILDTTNTILKRKGRRDKVVVVGKP